MTHAGDELLREWSARHGGYDAGRSALVTGWLRMVHALARPLAASGISPDAVTAAGVASGIAAAMVAGPGPRSRRLAAGLVVLTGLLDGLDGAVALRRDASRPPRRHGARLDRSADRVTDCCFAVALGRAGAPAPVVAAALAGTFGYEQAAARARRTGPVVVTPGERPLRVAYAAVGLACAPTAGATGVAVTTALGVVTMQPPR